MKQAVLLVSYGKAAENHPVYRLADAVKKAFSQVEVRTAFDLEQGLLSLNKDGFQKVTILPTHLIPGVSYRKLCETAAKWEQRFPDLQIGTPLLADAYAQKAVMDGLMREIPREKQEGLILLGHGSPSDADAVYSALQKICDENCFVVTLYDSVNDLLIRLQNKGIRRVVLTPILYARGVHAGKDLNHLANALSQNGMYTGIDDCPLGEREFIIELYLQKLRKMLVPQEIRLQDGYALCLAKKEDALSYYRQNFCPLDRQTAHLTGSKSVFTQEEVVGFFEKCVDASDRFDYMLTNPNGDIIGESVINEIDWERKTGNFRLALFHPEDCEKGLGTQMVQETCRFAFEVLGLSALELEVYAINPRAKHVYEKCGFQTVETYYGDVLPDGTVTDCYLMRKER